MKSPLDYSRLIKTPFKVRGFGKCNFCQICSFYFQRSINKFKLAARHKSLTLMAKILTITELGQTHIHVSPFSWRSNGANLSPWKNYSYLSDFDFALEYLGQPELPDVFSYS